MCFHIKQSKDVNTIEKRFNASLEFKEGIDPVKNYHAFTYPKTPVISNTDTGLIQYFTWGLIPFWAANDTIKKFTLIAKIETLNEKPAFKTQVKKRCIIIADGFYEWQWLDNKGKVKQKYLITFPDDELFAFGGLWSKWKDKSTGEIKNTFTVVTTEANGLMSEINNSQKRMPVILNKENETAWLNNEDFELFRKTDVVLKAVEL